MPVVRQSQLQHTHAALERKRLFLLLKAKHAESASSAVDSCFLGSDLSSPINNAKMGQNKGIKRASLDHTRDHLVQHPGSQRANQKLPEGPCSRAEKQSLLSIVCRQHWILQSAPASGHSGATSHQPTSFDIPPLL